MSNSLVPGGVEIYAYFSKILGPRSMAAGLRISFGYGQTRGIQFSVPVNEEYREAIIKGIKDGMSERFIDFRESGSVSIKEHPIHSSRWAFYLAARLVIEQAYMLTQLKVEELTKQASE
jgi:hypothetical protein